LWQKVGPIVSFDLNLKIVRRYSLIFLTSSVVLCFTTAI
jgi:hypothetical protein